MKPGLLLNASTIPQVRQVTRQGLPVALNRYVLDYWQHGQKQALVQANHLREGRSLADAFCEPVIEAHLPLMVGCILKSH